MWHTDLALYDTRITGVRALNDAKIVVEQELGRFTVLNAADGSIEYRYNTEHLAAIDPEHSMGYYGGYRPFEGSALGDLLLFDGTSDSLHLDLATGVIDSITGINAQSPSGCVVQKTLRHNRLVVLCPDEIRLRSVNPHY